MYGSSSSSSQSGDVIRDMGLTDTTGTPDEEDEHFLSHSMSKEEFQFPNKPIEVEALRLEEVEIEQRVNQKRKHYAQSQYSVTSEHALSNDQPSVDEGQCLDADLSRKETPLFQRVNVGEQSSVGIPREELNQAAKLLCEALHIRAKYMALSLQSFNPTTARSLQTVNNDQNLEQFYNNLSEEHLEAPRALCELDTEVRTIFYSREIKDWPFLTKYLPEKWT